MPCLCKNLSFNERFYFGHYMPQHSSEAIKGAVLACYKNDFKLAKTEKFIKKAFDDETVFYDNIN